MEKIPAACAMEWSIQLEKSLRSQIPVKCIEALEEIGRRLEWWNSDSELTFAGYKMFGLIPGEDKLFLNAIFLRLADAFRLGNKQIKNGVVKLFLRMKRRKKRDGEGIFSKGKLENYLELLSRVKEVFEKGDVEEKALALLLFGCWAHFAKDCADIRYIVLSSLVSSDALEVKAALFAAGCLSEFSDDFANVFFEILTTVVLSREMSSSVKLAGARAFAKIWCPFSLADKAYKTGLKLLMDSSEDDFSSVMLISLSRIASRWMLLIPTQIELLTFFQGEERSLHIQATSLRCHHLMLSRGVCNFPSTIGTIHKLFGILDRTELHPTLQLEALRVLHKILLFNLSIIPCMEIPELFLKLLVVIKSSIVSTRLLTIRILADIFNKVLGRVDLVSGGTGSTLALQVISFVLDQILSLVKPVKPQVDIYQANSDVELEVKNLLNTLFILVENHSYLHCLVLSNICLFVDRLMKMLNEVMDTEKIGLSNNETAEFGSHGKPLLSKLMLYISKIVVACLLNLEQTDNKTSQVLDSLKLQAENVCNCNFFGSYTGIRYFLLSHLLATVSYILHSAEELVFPSRNTSLSRVNSILQLDAFTLDFAKKMLGRNSYWYSYKAGKTAACQGAWSTAAFIFKQLVTVVQSASSSCWLKSLAQFSNSEEQIQLFLLRDEGISTVPSESNIGERGGLALRTIYRNYTENLLRACNTLLSAEEILAGSDMGHVFSFQRWFLTLRAKVLKTVVDILKLLDTILFVQDGIGTGGQLEGGILLLPASSVTLDPLIYSSMEGSCRMMKLAREVDLLLTCFTGMDRQSVMSVSALALRCSLMAFTAGFAFLVPNSHPSENYRKFGDLEGLSHALLIEDLVGRLRDIDCETRKSLVTLLKSFGNCKVCFSPRFQNEISYASHEATVLHKLCKYSVGEIFSLQNEATKLQQDGNVGSQIRNSGLQLLLNIISNLMLIPFRTPHHFFHVRPSVSSELLVMNEDGQTVGGSSISSGSHLSLNLSFQLRNMKADCPSPLKKAYCIINCTIHSQITTETGDSKIDDMMDLNEKLLRYVNRSTKINGPHCRDQNSDLLTVNEYVCFEVNDRGQGFSSCLLDVSSFPVGSYRIKWHSGYVDSGGSYWSLLPVNSGPLFTVCT